MVGGTYTLFLTDFPPKVEHNVAWWNYGEMLDIVYQIKRRQDWFMQVFTEFEIPQWVQSLCEVLLEFKFYLDIKRP